MIIKIANGFINATAIPQIKMCNIQIYHITKIKRKENANASETKNYNYFTSVHHRIPLSLNAFCKIVSFTAAKTSLKSKNKKIFNI